MFKRRVNKRKTVRRAYKRKGVRRVYKRKSARSYGNRRRFKRTYRRGRTFRGVPSVPQVDSGSGSLMSKSRMPPMKRRKVTVSKMVKANEQLVQTRWSAVHQFRNTAEGAYNFAGINTQGAYALLNYNDESYTILPCHLFDITSCINRDITGIVPANPSWQLHKPSASSSGSKFFFNGMSGDTFAGINAATSWQPENIPAASGPSLFPNRRTILRNVSAKFLFYGSEAAPVTFTVSLVRFTNDCNPGSYTDTYVPPTSLQEKQFQQYTGLWDHVAKKLVGHPINDSNSRNAKNMHVIRKEEFTIQPVAEMYNGRNLLSNIHQFEMNLPLGKILRFDWADGAIDPNLLDGGAFASNEAQTWNQVKPDDRLYIMVTANNFQQAGPAVPDSSTVPSYDIVIKQNLVNIT